MIDSGCALQSSRVKIRVTALCITPCLRLGLSEHKRYKIELQTLFCIGNVPYIVVNNDDGDCVLTRLSFFRITLYCLQRLVVKMINSELEIRSNSCINKDGTAAR